MTRYLFFYIAFIFFSLPSQAMLISTPIDSLEIQLKQAKTLKDSIQKLISLTNQFEYTDLDSGMRYATMALEKAITSNDTALICKSQLVLGDILVAQGNYDQGKKKYEASLVLCEKAQLDTLIGESLNYLLSYYYYTNKIDSGIFVGKKALQKFRMLKDTLGISIAFSNLALLYEIIGYNDSTIWAFNEAEKMANMAHDESMLATIYSNLEGMYLEEGRYIKALKYGQKALSIIEKLPQDDQIAYEKTLALNNMALIYDKFNQDSLALSYFYQIKVLYDKVNNPFDIAILYNNIADIHFKNKSFDSTRYYLSAAFNAVKGKESFNEMGDLYLSSGKLCMEMQHYDSALSCFKKAYQYLGKFPDSQYAVDVEKFLAEAYYKLGNNEKAMHYAKMAKEKASHMSSFVTAKETSYLLATLYQSKGQYKLAYNNLSEAFVYNDSMINDEKLLELEAIKYKYELDKKELANHLLEEQNEVSTKALKMKDMVMKRQNVLNIEMVVTTIILAVLIILLIRANLQKRQVNATVVGQNEQLSRQKLELEELNGVKDKLLSVISHDLKSPLNSLQGIVKLFNQGYMSEQEIKDHAQKVSTTLDFTYDMLENLLQWAKTQLKGADLNIISFDGRSAILLNTELIANQSKQKNQHLEIDIAETSFHIRADRDQFDIVLRNILTNAIKFTPEGGTIKVKASSNEVDGMVHVKICDEGVGMSQSMIEKIKKGDFVSSVGTNNEKGTGLGLILCSEYLELNHGKLLIDSEEGNGSCFTIVLPIA